MAKTTELLPEHIKLFPLDDTCTLFYHTETMQLYPISDPEIVRFLDIFLNKGRACTEIDFGKAEFDDYYNALCELIASSPQMSALDIGVASTHGTRFEEVVLPISGHCTLRCPYCFAQTDGKFKFRDFEVEDIEKTVDFVIEHRHTQGDKQPLWFIFFGGEPLLRFDLIRHTLQYVKEKYPDEEVYYSITTNGTILNDSIIQLFKDNKFSVLVSLDGPDNEFNLRKDEHGRSSFHRVMKFIEAMKNNGIRTELRATLVNTNPYIVDTFAFFEQLQLPFFISFAYASENKGHTYSSYDDELLTSIGRQFEQLGQYYRTRIQNRQTIFNQRFYQFGNALRFRQNKTIACGAARTYFTMMADGTIFSCAHFMNNTEHAIGHISSGTNEQAEQYKALDIETIAECNMCWAKYLCLGHCVAQKINIGKRNDTASGENECELERLQIAFYLKLFYYAQTLQPFAYFDKKDAKEVKAC
ncbi:MAG: radical SAM protein [Bacteroidales bacterium]|nr:radical SAM protein [Bacteroidales bacterium]